MKYNGRSWQQYCNCIIGIRVQCVEILFKVTHEMFPRLKNVSSTALGTILHGLFDNIHSETSHKCFHNMAKDGRLAPLST